MGDDFTSLYTCENGSKTTYIIMGIASTQAINHTNRGRGQSTITIEILHTKQTHNSVRTHTQSHGRPFLSTITKN